MRFSIFSSLALSGLFVSSLAAPVAQAEHCDVLVPRLEVPSQQSVLVIVGTLVNNVKQQTAVIGITYTRNRMA